MCVVKKEKHKNAFDTGQRVKEKEYLLYGRIFRRNFKAGLCA